MVAMGVTWNGLTRPFFIDKTERLNAGKHIDVLMLYKRELFENDDCKFQQMVQVFIRVVYLKIT